MAFDRKLYKEVFPTGANMDELLGSNPDFQVERRSLATLKPRKWLNDTVIDTYMSLIVKMSTKKSVLALPCHVYSVLQSDKLTPSSKQSFIKKTTKDINLLDKDLVLIPINKDNHWLLVILEPRERRILYYDSFYEERYTTTVIKNIGGLINRNYTTSRPSGWTVKMDEDGPRQTNNHDCGIFICHYAKTYVAGSPNKIPKGALRMMRLKVMRELLDGCLLDFEDSSKPTDASHSHSMNNAHCQDCKVFFSGLDITVERHDDDCSEKRSSSSSTECAESDTGRSCQRLSLDCFERFKSIIKGFYKSKGYESELPVRDSRGPIEPAIESCAVVVPHDSRVFVVFIPPSSEHHKRIYYLLDGKNECQDPLVLGELNRKVGLNLVPISVDRPQEEETDSRALAATIVLALRRDHKGDKRFQVRSPLVLPKALRNRLIRDFANPKRGTKVKRSKVIGKTQSENLRRSTRGQ